MIVYKTFKANFFSDEQLKKKKTDTESDHIQSSLNTMTYVQ